MTRVGKPDRLSTGGAHKTGWLVSAGLHGSLVLGALVLLQQMQLALQQEPFEWNVAMVQPVDSHSPTAAASESPPNTPAPTKSQTLAPRTPEPAPAPPPAPQGKMTAHLVAIVQWLGPRFVEPQIGRAHV